jgi:hypothetical protein
LELNMENVQGTVQNAWAQQKVSKAGKNYTVNYIQLDTYPAPISTGFKSEHQNGETVNIWIDKKYGEMQKVAAPAQGAPAQVSAPPQAAPPVRTAQVAEFPIAPGSRQMSIIRQSSLKCAVEAFGTFDASGFNDIDEYSAAVLNLALKFTDFGSGQDIREVLGQ